VCLHEFTVWVTLQASYQHNRSALPRNVPTNCGSRVLAADELIHVHAFGLGGEHHARIWS
jgi:hypothetical protein